MTMKLTPPNRNSAPAAMNRDKISSFFNIFLGLKFLQVEAFETGMEKEE
jgi:hypothetical protein